VQTFAALLAAETGGAALPFLDRLSRALFTRMDRHIRIDGAAQAPAHTLAIGRGACRDLTVLFMAACRGLGIAARFVSGYQAQADTPDGQRHLHAWPEVFLPGLGWRGFDPTHGIAVTDGHVALCAAPDQAATMPVEGGFFGNGATAALEYRVQIATA
jgi:transglutaminase-like putative cysteine protease